MDKQELTDSSLICGICGEYHKYSNCDIIEIIKHVPDKITPSRARLTLPTNVNLEVMADGSYSIKANTFISRGTQFGPLEAQKLLTLKPAIVFPLKLFVNEAEDLSEYYLDTTDEHKSNWLIFIPPALNLEEQNLICFQEESKIFYVTIKDIKVGEFLRVWYAPYYAVKMNSYVLTNQDDSEWFNNNITFKSTDIDINTCLKNQQKIINRDNWTCKFCGKVENDVTHFAKHMLNHYNKKQECTICKQLFQNLSDLKKHTKTIHPKKPVNLKCSKPKIVISQNLKTKADCTLVGGPLLNDLLTDSSDNIYLVLPSTDIMENQSLLESDSLSLTVDNLVTENMKELDHFNFEIGESQEQHVCDICLKVFTKLTYLLQHLRKHTGEHMCRSCLKIFTRCENLKSHNCKNDDKLPPFICNHCEHRFILKKYLVRHIKVIHEKKYTCENCNHNYYSPKEYKQHNCSAIPNSLKETFTCMTCNKKFFKEIYLKKHMRLHMQRDKQLDISKYLLCDVCTQGFKTKVGLERHKQIHIEPSFSCKICSKKFYRQTALNNHIKIHDDNKFTCSVCNAELKSKRILATHMFQHTGIKPYKCDKCFQSFHQKSNLIKHSRKHLFSCQVCNEIFNTEELLHKHKSEHFRKEVFICPLCEKVIKLRSSLRRHLKKYHNEVDIDQVMCNVKAKKLSFEKNITNNNPLEVSSNPLMNPLPQTESDNFQSIVDSFENIMNRYNAEEETSNLLLDTYGAESDKTDGRMFDFNDLEIDMDSNFDLQQNMNVNEREVCLSMPDLAELDQEITLGENAYILDNGTIVEPKEQGQVLYVLNK